MRIQRRRIRNPERYLTLFLPGDDFYIAAPISPEMKSIIEAYDINQNGAAFIPKPIRSATMYNANGRWVVDKTLPKEPRLIEHDYHIIDWHGNDHYGTCWQTRMCYQRTLLPPPEIAFRVQNGVLFSPLLRYHELELERIKTTVNIVLEMFGFCELWTVKKAPASPPVHQETVPWEILREGTRDKAEWEHYLSETTKNRSDEQKAIIKRRHEHFWDHKPDLCVLGRENFWGYVVYGFEKTGLYFFECNQPNNATYVFSGDWESASKLTKTEVLASDLQEARIFHTDAWYSRTHSLMS